MFEYDFQDFTYGGSGTEVIPIKYRVEGSMTPVSYTHLLRMEWFLRLPGVVLPLQVAINGVSKMEKYVKELVLISR